MKEQKIHTLVWDESGKLVLDTYDFQWEDLELNTEYIIRFMIS